MRDTSSAQFSGFRCVLSSSRNQIEVRQATVQFRDVGLSYFNPLSKRAGIRICFQGTLSCRLEKAIL